jgi:succinylglutamate desuccinylase
VGTERGGTLVIVAGIHGNEPAGLHAARRVLARLEHRAVPLSGELVVLAGNLEALRLGVRYQARDLNRLWGDEPLGGAATPAEGDSDAEAAEQRELSGALEEIIGRARGPVHVADLHTSSAAGFPFVLFGDTLAQRRFVEALPISILLGLEEQIDGVLAASLTRRGCIAFSVEGGQHTDPRSIDALEAVIWLSLAQARMVPRSFDEIDRAHQCLEALRAEAPRFVEVLSRHAITVEDGFRMEPGFRNIERARAGQLLARDRRGEVRAPVDGCVVLPLYQGLGSDGYFWGRELSRREFQATARLRQSGIDQLLPLLPGVRRDGAMPGRLALSERAARLYPLRLFASLGYRKVRTIGGQLTVSRSGRERSPGA